VTTGLTRTPAVVESFPLVRTGGDVVYVATTSDRRRSALVSMGREGQVLSPSSVWVERAAELESMMVVSGFPSGARLGWRGYVLGSEATEIPGTTGMHWLTAPKDGTVVAGTVAGTVGDSGEIDRAARLRPRLNAVE
jgi:hypothetical protein